MSKFKLIPADQVPETGVKLIDLKYDTIGVYRLGGEIHAYLDSCPHTDAPMGPDCLHDGEIVCPLHGATFDAGTGAVKSPPATSGLIKFGVEVKDGEIYIDYEE